MATIQNIPKLRFPGFDGEWELKKLGEIITNKSGKFNPVKEKYFTKCIELEHLATGKGQLLGFIDGRSSGSIKNKFNEGDVLFGKLRPYLKKYLLAPFDGVCSSEIWVLKGIKISNFFLYQIVQTNKFIDLANQSSGSKMPRADWNVVENGIFSSPTLPEQQKIASFLSAVDEKIQQLSRKKELLEQYKKGVMQQLFSGKLRFKDENGNDYPDWEEKKLGEVANKKSSNISANKIEDNFGDFIIYGASGILKKVDFYIEENDYISIVKDGAGVGRLLYCKGKSSVLGTMEIISPKQNLDTYFLYCLLSNIDFVKYVTGSTIPHIYFKDYSNEICGIPNFTEQQKIANFLSNIDVKIENTNQEIIQMQKFKKGLLQQLFV